ncbi:MAG: Gfo/Idh/MocA family protein [Bacteroidia bacterium]
MIKIGVLGAGHLGKIHIKLLNNLKNDFQLVGFYDPNKEMAKAAEKEFGITYFSSYEELFENVDAVDIVTPTLSHHECASSAIRQFKHVFIEKPITSTVEEAKSLITLAEEAKIIAQVGHVERFNPAFLSVKSYLKNPMFIESHRLAQFNPRGTDVSVVLDLMIHDLDIILSVVNSSIKKISASGVSIVSDSPDIANARVEFDNGCVANITTSRISMKNMRKTRFFQSNAYISVDYLEKKSEIINIKESDEKNPFAVVIDLGEGKAKKEIEILKPEVLANNAIEEELKSFAASIRNQKPIEVPLTDGYNALNVATQIMEKIKLGTNIIQS